MEYITFSNKPSSFLSFLLLSFLLSPFLSVSSSKPSLIFKDKQLAVVYPITQAFKRTVTEDPFQITTNWVGSDICNYRGLYCNAPPDNRSALAVVGVDISEALLAAPTLEGFADKLPDLVQFHAKSNKISGCLPYEIGNLSRAKVFDVAANELTGPVPHSFGCLKKIELLNLADNHFYGEVPEIVCKLSKVENLSFSNNYFTQVGPACRGLIRENKLDVRNNCILDLPSQKPKAKCATFFSKRLNCERKESFKSVPCIKGEWF